MKKKENNSKKMINRKELKSYIIKYLITNKQSIKSRGEKRHIENKGQNDKHKS